MQRILKVDVGVKNIAVEKQQVDLVAFGQSLNRRGAVVFGDIVTAVNGHPVSTVEEMRTMFDSCKPGDLAELTVVRNRQTRQVKFRLVEE